jgi:D-amino-acid dehydrogenase
MIPAPCVGAAPVLPPAYHRSRTSTTRCNSTREDDAGFDARLTAGGVHEALSEALRFAPGLAGATLHELRFGLRPASPDRLPMLGPLPGYPSVFVLTGFGANGLQLGPYCGALLADLILGRPAALDLTPYSPARFQ